MLREFSQRVLLVPPIYKSVAGLKIRDDKFLRNLERILNKLYLNGVNHLVLIKGIGDYSIINDFDIINQFVISKYDLMPRVEGNFELPKNLSSPLSNEILELVPTIQPPPMSGKVEPRFVKILRDAVRQEKIRLLCAFSYEDLHTNAGLRKQKGGNITLSLTEVGVQAYINGGPIRLDYILP